MPELRLVGEVVIDDSEVPTFDLFWLLWPQERRVCKKEARDAWNKIRRNQWPHVIERTLLWRNYWYATDQDWRYLMHPHRWLAKERYDDEIPAAEKHGSHAAAQIPESGERTRMPEHVRAAIARLKK